MGQSRRAVTGTITSAPTAVAGTVIPRYTLEALDGSKAQGVVPNLWTLAMPLFNASPTMFSTVAATCGGTSPYCAIYALAVPAQSPVYPVSGGNLQAATPPTFTIYAEPDNSSLCVPSFAFSPWQLDGKSSLTATPGARLTAQSISLTNCH